MHEKDFVAQAGMFYRKKNWEREMILRACIARWADRIVKTENLPRIMSSEFQKQSFKS